MQQVRALDTRGLQNDGGEEKRRRLQLRTVFTEKGKLKNRGAFAPLFFYVRTRDNNRRAGARPAASAAAPNGAIYLCREYPIIGVPIDKVNGVKYPTF